MNQHQNNTFGLQVAEQINSAKEAEWPELVRGLYRTRRLSRAIHELNNLQHDPQHADAANAAIKRIGLH